MLGIPIGITSSAIGLINCAINAWIKKYKSIISKKKRKHCKIVLLTKSKLNSIEFLISKTLIDSNISHDKFVLIINILKEYEDVRKEIKNLRLKQFIEYLSHRIVWSVKKLQKVNSQTL